MVYLQQFLAQSEGLSRRSAVGLIKQGKVKINGQSAVLGIKVNPALDKVSLSGRAIKPVGQKVYYLLNKPPGYHCTLSDKFAAKKVVDLVPHRPKVWPVGRLDKDSSGLIVLTNDGDLTNRLTHPKFKHQKEYLVFLNQPIAADLPARLKNGIGLKEGLTKADQVKQISPTTLSITLHQGWNRQIRRMLAACGYKVVELKRIRIGQIKLGGLKPGQYIKTSSL